MDAWTLGICVVSMIDVQAMPTIHIGLLTHTHERSDKRSL